MRPADRLATAARAWALAGGALLLAIVAVTAVNVGAFALDTVTRNLGVRVPGLPGYEDFVRLAIGPAFLMLFPHCQLVRGHVTADVFTDRLPARLKRRLDTLWRWLTAAAAAALGAGLAVGMLETRADNVLSPILGWAEWPFQLPAIVSLFLWAAAAALPPGQDGE